MAKQKKQLLVDIILDPVNAFRHPPKTVSMIDAVPNFTSHVPPASSLSQAAPQGGTQHETISVIDPRALTSQAGTASLAPFSSGNVQMVPEGSNIIMPSYSSQDVSLRHQRTFTNTYLAHTFLAIV
jgi:hypothetical protein